MTSDRVSLDIGTKIKHLAKTGLYTQKRQTCSASLVQSVHRNDEWAVTPY